MTRCLLWAAAIAAVAPIALSAQQPQPGETAMRPVEPGVASMIVMDRPDVRVLRNTCDPGGTRRVHQHDNISYHLFILIAGELQMTIASDPPIDVKPGQVLYLKPSVPHSFTNKGKETALMVEVFGKPAAAGAANQNADIGAVLAAAIRSNSNK